MFFYRVFCVGKGFTEQYLSERWILHQVVNVDFTSYYTIHKVLSKKFNQKHVQVGILYGVINLNHCVCAWRLYFTKKIAFIIFIQFLSFIQYYTKKFIWKGSPPVISPRVPSLFDVIFKLHYILNYYKLYKRNG
jgi:hypothetical protein